MAKKKREPVNCPVGFPPITDHPTQVAGLGWRFLYTIAAYAVLAIGIMPGTGFFVSLALFILPLLMDYCRFDPDTFLRKTIKMAGVAYSGIFLLISFWGLAGVITVQQINTELCLVISRNFLVGKGHFCSLTYVWYCVGFSIALTAIDWIAYKEPFQERSDNRSKLSAQSERSSREDMV